jgi:hypothetical protein
VDIDPRRVEVISERMAATLRGLSAPSKLRMSAAMMTSLRHRLALNLRRDHSSWTTAEVEAEIKRRIFGGTG